MECKNVRIPLHELISWVVILLMVMKSAIFVWHLNPHVKLNTAHETTKANRSVIDCFVSHYFFKGFDFCMSDIKMKLCVRRCFENWGSVLSLQLQTTSISLFSTTPLSVDYWIYVTVTTNCSFIIDIDLSKIFKLRM